jgi:tRNA threonylcarbamoyladenosine biosynthesis protein TsaE
METFTTDNVEATEALGRELAPRFNRGECLALVGDLGAGKTAFVRGLAAGWDVADKRLVSSPTFVLIHEYDGPVPVFHVDVYRLSDPERELVELGLAEMLTEGVVVIEWADRVDGVLPRPHWRIAIEAIGEQSRRFELDRIAE